MKRFAHGATDAPDPSRTPKLSGASPGRYCGGGLLNFSFRLNSEVKRRKIFKIILLFATMSADIQLSAEVSPSDGAAAPASPSPLPETGPGWFVWETRRKCTDHSICFKIVR